MLIRSLAHRAATPTARARAELVAPLALRLDRSRAAVVLAPRHRLQVSQIAAAAITAEVVYRQLGRELADCQLIRYAIGETMPRATVAVAVDVPDPRPAFRRRVASNAPPELRNVYATL